jgi:GTP-sensing pleiotropic transcriptional regulator CodY
MTYKCTKVPFSSLFQTFKLLSSLPEFKTLREYVPYYSVFSSNIHNLCIIADKNKIKGYMFKDTLTGIVHYGTIKDKLADDYFQSLSKKFSNLSGTDLKLFQQNL